MAEQVKQVLELFTQPAFLSKDGIISWCNAAAKPFVQEGAALADVTQGNDALLRLWDREGTAQISFTMQSTVYEASVRAYEDMLLFVLQSKISQTKPASAALLNASASLRRPLHNLISSASTLFDLLVSDETKQAASGVNRAIYQLMRLCGQMSDGSRLLLGQIKARRVPTDMQTFFDRFLAQVRPLVDACGRTLIFIPSCCSTKADVDTELLERALLNLVSNALSYTSSGGEITLQVQKMAKHLLITVSDDGEGLRPEVFSHPSESDDERALTDYRFGLGYGLSMVREIAQLHGGSMMFSDSDGQSGTRIVFTLSTEPTKLELRSPYLHYDYCSGLNHTLVELSDVLSCEHYDPSQI